MTEPRPLPPSPLEKIKKKWFNKWERVSRLNDGTCDDDDAIDIDWIAFWEQMFAKIEALMAKEKERLFKKELFESGLAAEEWAKQEKSEQECSDKYLEAIRHLENAMKELEDKDNELAAKDKDIEMLKAELEKNGAWTRKQLDDFAEVMSQKDARIKDLEETIDKMDRVASSIKPDLTIIKKELKDKTNALNGWKGECGELEKENVELKTRIKAIAALDELKKAVEKA